MARRTRASTQAVGDPQSIYGDEFTIDEIIDRHRDRWVVMLVSGYDDDYWPAKGYVIVSARRQQAALDELERLADDQPLPRWGGFPIYSFLAQPDIGPAEFEAFLQQLLTEGRTPT